MKLQAICLYITVVVEAWDSKTNNLRAHQRDLQETFTLQPTPSAFTLGPTPTSFEGITLQPTPTSFCYRITPQYITILQQIYNKWVLFYYKYLVEAK